MSENVGASTSRNPKGLHDLYSDSFTIYFTARQYSILNAASSSSSSSHGDGGGSESGSILMFYVLEL
jgi:hypothetical protein